MVNHCQSMIESLFINCHLMVTDEPCCGDHPRNGRSELQEVDTSGKPGKKNEDSEDDVNK